MKAFGGRIHILVVCRIQLIENLSLGAVTLSRELALSC